MNAAPMMTASSAGPSLSASASSRRMLPIRQNLNQLNGINRTYKAVLIEVCELVENGTQGKCTAQNDYFAERLSGSLRTVSRTITGLEQAGLLTSSGATNKRILLPTPRLRACYAGTDTTAAIRALSAALSDGPTIDKTIAKTGSTIDTPAKMAIVKTNPTIDNRDTTIANRGSNYSQTGSRVYRDDHYEQDEVEEEGALRSALAAAEKKIEQLEYDNRQLRASVLAQRPGGANASASHTGGARRISFVESEFATEHGFRTLAASMNCANACPAYYLPDMRVKAAGLDTRDAAGWRLWVHAWLKRDRDSTGVVEKQPTGKPGPKAGQVDKRRSAIEEAMAMDDAEND